MQPQQLNIDPVLHQSQREFVEQQLQLRTETQPICKNNIYNSKHLACNNIKMKCYQSSRVFTQNSFSLDC
ncbi:hypothetical protein HCU40_06735 [Pseudanabaena biceps]|nr:hypothetical protein [Pseudanabaena biceps]